MIKFAIALGLLIGGGEAPVQEEPTPTQEVAEEKNWWDSFVENYLSADKIAMYMSWVAYIGTIIGLVANVNKLRKQNHLTLSNVSEDVQAKIGETVSKEVQTYMPTWIATQDKTNEMLNIFAKMIALSQENTPEAKVAILNLVEQMGSVNKEVLQEAKDTIEKQVEEAKAKKEETVKKVDEIIDQYDGTSI